MTLVVFIAGGGNADEKKQRSKVQANFPKNENKNVL